MTRTIALALALAVLSVIETPAQQNAVERVAWLQGCWEMTSSQGSVEEHWMAPRGGTMIGTGRTVRNNKLVEYELVIIREQGELLAYEAHPSGQPPAVFLSRELTASSVIFEDPVHDFPQRIGYRASGREALIAWIEGTDKGQARRLEFSYRRAAC